MRAAYFAKHGGPEVIEVGELPEPEPGPTDVLLDVRAAALNHLDIWVRKGGRAFPLPLPHVGGTDVAGVVAEVGDRLGEGAPAVGDEVIVNPGLNFVEDDAGHLVPPPRPDIVGETRWGGLAERCVVPASNVLPKPPGLDWAQAAALPLTALTARQMLRKADLGQSGPGERVLVLGAGGGVSVMAVQIAKALGARVTATTSTGKVDKVEALGADLVIDYVADPDWSKAAFLATGKQGFDVVVDSVGAATFTSSVRSLAPGGRLVTCGATTGESGTLDIRQLFWKQASIHGSTMGSQRDLEEVVAMVAAGTVRPVVDSVWSLDDARGALEHLERGAQFGKVVVKP